MSGFRFCTIALFAFSALMLYLPASVADVSFPDKPNRKDYFVDRASLIEPEQAKQINEIAKAILREEKPRFMWPR